MTSVLSGEVAIPHHSITSLSRPYPRRAVLFGDNPAYVVEEAVKRSDAKKQQSTIYKSNYICGGKTTWGGTH